MCYLVRITRTFIYLLVYLSIFILCLYCTLLVKATVHVIMYNVLGQATFFLNKTCVKCKNAFVNVSSSTKKKLYMYTVYNRHELYMHVY